MIRVAVRIDPYYQDRFRPWTSVVGKLRDAGYELRLNPEGDASTGDVNVVQLDYLTENPQLFGELIQQNLIIYERTGCAPLNHKGRVRRLANDSRLRGWIKDILFRDPALYNAPAVNNRHHLTYLPMPDGTVPEPVLPQIALTPEAVAKIGSFLPIHMYPRMDPFLKENPVPPSKRRIQALFAGNMDFPLPQVERHRQAACEALLALRKRVAIFTGNLLPGDHYVAMLRRPRMMLSPYGSGGYSWKDFECMYMGIVLIKPDNEFSLTYGFDLFDGEKHLIKCRPDFSDLPLIVEKVMDEPDRYDELTASNRAAILAARDGDKLAHDLVGLFARAVA